MTIRMRPDAAITRVRADLVRPDGRLQDIGTPTGLRLDGRRMRLVWEVSPETARLEWQAIETHIGPLLVARALPRFPRPASRLDPITVIQDIWLREVSA